MGKVTNPKPVQYFTSILFKDEGPLQYTLAELKHVIGAIQENAGPMPFSHTSYYEEEMGKNLSRYFVLFAPLLERGLLPEIKLKTNTMEEVLSVGGKRTVNIDPGCISLENIILATTKGYTHRIYLAKGIFADLTLIYNNGGFRPLMWTYPDYKEEKIISLFNRWRNQYKQVLR